MIRKAATISSRYQITLPVSLCRRLRLNRRDRLLIADDRGRIVLTPMGSIVQQTAGSLTKYIAPQLLGKPWDEIMETTKHRVATYLATKR